MGGLYRGEDRLGDGGYGGRTTGKGIPGGWACGCPVSFLEGLVCFQVLADGAQKGWGGGDRAGRSVVGCPGWWEQGVLDVSHDVTWWGAGRWGPGPGHGWIFLKKLRGRGEANQGAAGPKKTKRLPAQKFPAEFCRKDGGTQGTGGARGGVGVGGWGPPLTR